MKNYTLKVNNVKQETKDTVTLCFKQPGLKKIKYLAGQYLTLSFRINGRKYIRPYSFSSSPLVDFFLETTIKRVPNGIVSNYINDTIKSGDIIEVMEPMGDFVYIHNDIIDQVYFWGVGSGITPLLSIMKEILVSTSSIDVNLIYGNRNAESTIFLEDINQLIIKYPNNLKVWHFHTQVDDIRNKSVNQGRINKEFILNLLKAGSIEKTAHYICGPADLKNLIKSTLNILECPNENIFSEDFELVKNPKDFEDIVAHNVNIHFQGKEIVVEVAKGKSVLEASLDAGIELPYSCQTGSCNTCKGKLVAGELRMIGLSNGRDDLEFGDYLLCCSYPLTNGVCVEI